MKHNASRIPAAAVVEPHAADLPPPHWVRELLGLWHAQRRARRDGVGAPSLLVSQRNGFALVTARVPGAARMPGALLEDRVAAAYAEVAGELGRLRASHPVRFWNHIPDITTPAGDGRDRYMAFNAGRYRAFVDWFGGPQHFNRHVATASGVGHEGPDLVIHCLAADEPGAAVENPRQIPAYRYSARYGALPPCFARATRLRHPANLLLVGGTASVKGEDSVHLRDWPAQLDETLRNMACLLCRAVGLAWDEQDPDWIRHLEGYRDLRVYLPDPTHEGDLTVALRQAFPHLRRLEIMPSDLCRKELLVEIEGLAELEAS